MQFERETFHKPARTWLWVLLPPWIAVLLVSIFKFKVLISTKHPALSEKYGFLFFFGFTLLVTYMLVGYLYHSWATPLKNKLIELSYSNHRVLVYQYSRFFVNEALLQDNQIAAKPYTRLSQRDLKEVAARIGIEKR